MISKITLSKMKFYAHHGVLPQETVVGNYFTVDLEITADLEKAVISDNLEDTINYAEIYGIVKREMLIPSRLLEHAAGRILYSLHQEFPRITALTVTLSKRNPPFGGDIHSASVTLQESFR